MNSQSKIQYVSMGEYAVVHRCNDQNIVGVGTTGIGPCLGVLGLSETKIFVCHFYQYDTKGINNLFDVLKNSFEDDPLTGLIFYQNNCQIDICTSYLDQFKKPTNDLYRNILSSLFNTHLSCLNLRSNQIRVNKTTDRPNSFIAYLDGRIVDNVGLHEFNKTPTDPLKLLEIIRKSLQIGHMENTELYPAPTPLEEKYQIVETYYDFRPKRI